jgi:hypothetical protein
MQVAPTRDRQQEICAEIGIAKGPSIRRPARTIQSRTNHGAQRGSVCLQLKRRFEFSAAKNQQPIMPKLVKTTAVNDAEDVGNPSISILFEKCGANGQLFRFGVAYVRPWDTSPLDDSPASIPGFRVLQSKSCKLQAIVSIADQ